MFLGQKFEVVAGELRHYCLRVEESWCEEEGEEGGDVLLAFPPPSCSSDALLHRLVWVAERRLTLEGRAPTRGATTLPQRNDILHQESQEVQSFHRHRGLHSDYSCFVVLVLREVENRWPTSGDWEVV